MDAEKKIAEIKEAVEHFRNRFLGDDAKYLTILAQAAWDYADSLTAPRGLPPDANLREPRELPGVEK